ncbi:MAG: hypothetical protein OXN97_24605 [Bryobacterales bacterium]|nr:hypothetical protein [Bryobacterales bacterium]
MGCRVRRVVLQGASSLVRWAALAALAAGGQAVAETHFLVVEGLGGTHAYAERFRGQVTEMLPALRRMAGMDELVRVLAGVEATAERIEAEFGSLAGSVAPGDALGVLLVGHGSYDGKVYKLNIPGPDITDRQLKVWLDAVPAARQLIVSTTSSSGGALETLKSPRRVVITATKSGRERTATVFGEFWAKAFADAAADTDKNEAISALEAFRYAESKVASHFKDSQRLATEHPQLEGERPESFLLARLGSAARLAEDPAKRSLLLQREELERKIADLTVRKEDIPQDEYLESLQSLLLELAELQQRIDSEAAAPEGGEP